MHPDDWERFYHSHMEIMQDLREELLVEFRAKDRKGEYVWLKSRGKVLTESLAFKQVEVFQKKFQDMKKRNIRIALDDFGTGYCSLSVLKNMPVDIAKIDKSFVKDIRHNQFDVALIGLVTEICHAASIGVCLEGVEEEEEYECIKEIPLDFIQGYYFGKPHGKNAISRNLRKKVRG